MKAPRLLHAIAIAALPRQPDIQRPGHGRFRPAGIWRGVIFTVAHHDFQGDEDAAAKKRSGYDKQRCQSCRDEVKQIIQPRCPTAKGPVPGIAIADHAVSCIDYLIGKQARKTYKDKPESGGKYTVGQVFRACFDGGARDIALIHIGSGTANNHANGCPCGF